MRLPKNKADWKRLQPTNLKQALRLCKEYARQFKRLTVPAIAELMGVSEDVLYKWLSTGGIPAHLLPAYEHICGIDYVTQYMAYRSYKLMIDIPTGRAINEVDFVEMQSISADAMSLLLKFYQSGEGLEKTVSALTSLMKGIAYHRENIQSQPELDLYGDNDD